MRPSLHKISSQLGHTMTEVALLLFLISGIAVPSLMWLPENPEKAMCQAITALEYGAALRAHDFGPGLTYIFHYGFDASGKRQHYCKAILRDDSGTMTDFKIYWMVF